MQSLQVLPSVMPEDETFTLKNFRGTGSKGWAESDPFDEIGLTELQNIGGSVPPRHPLPVPASLKFVD